MENVILYTIDNCGYCEAAKRLLIDQEILYKEINIEGDEEEQMKLIKKTNHRTMPQIFIDDNFIGGYTELKAFLSQVQAKG